MNRHVINWISGWADMICGLLCVITFTLYRPWWDFKIRAWLDKRELKRRMSS